MKTYRRTLILSLCLVITVCCGSFASANSPQVKLTGNFQVEVDYEGQSTKFDIAPITWKNVTSERYANLPVYNPAASAWGRGVVLRGVSACECAVFGALDPESVCVKLEDGGDLVRGKDYEFENTSGALGRLEGGKITDTSVVFVDYRYVESRIDSIVMVSQGKYQLVPGEPKVLSPEPPVLKQGQKRLVNIYLTGRIEKLSEDSIFPVDEIFSNELDSLDAGAFVKNVEKYNLAVGKKSAPDVSSRGAIKRFLPKVWEKLTKGEEVKILAWGDSVTACGFLPDNQRWQVKFVDRLEKMFPKAKITLLTEAWGGRSSDSYRNEPLGSPKNYQEKVLALKPDLIVSEFVNDAYMNEETVQKRYGEMKSDFDAIGAGWIILGPHYVRPDWMGLTSERDTDVDPRPLVRGLRQFAEDTGTPFADTPELYGKLWRAGIPYNTLMTNNINHPNAFGMELFASALTQLFEE